MSRAAYKTNSKNSLIENEHASLWYYPDTKIVHHRFIQPVSGESFRNVLLAGLRLLREHKAQKWLSDDRNNSILSAEDRAWVQDYWEPLAIEAGWKYWAVLPPTNARGKINIQRLIEQLTTTRSVTVRVFSDPDKAYQWLDHPSADIKDIGEHKRGQLSK